jgi:hypothetical protein
MADSNQSPRLGESSIRQDARVFYYNVKTQRGAGRPNAGKRGFAEASAFFFEKKNQKTFLVWEDRRRKETSKYRLKKLTLNVITAFAYPSGAFTGTTASAGGSTRATFRVIATIV